jgi:AcrR family transcriptional regulator
VTALFPTRSWGREDEPDAAYHRLLDAAGEVFADRGVGAAKMSAVAAAAGCSRGTLYRYFPDADALRLAFVEREAGRVGERVVAVIEGLDDPPEVLVEACLVALREVRADPTLTAWFDPSASGVAGEVAGRAATIAGLVDSLLTALSGMRGGSARLQPDLDGALAADWVVRTILSLLAQPARPSGRRRSTASAERALLEQCLAPALFTGR